MREVVEELSWLIRRTSKLSHWVTLIALALLVSFMEALGAILIFGLLAMIAAPEQSISLPVLGRIDQRLVGGNTADLLLWFAFAVAVFYILRGVASLVQSYAQNRVSQNIGARLSSFLLYGYLRLPYSYHLTRNSAEFIRTMQTSTYTVISNALLPVVWIISESLLVMAVGLILAVTAPVGVLIAAPAMGLVVLFLIRTLQPRLAQLGAEVQTQWERNMQAMQQALQGQKEIRLLGREAFFRDVFSAGRQLEARALYMRSVLLDVPRVVIETILVLFILAFIGVAYLRETPLRETLAILGLFAYAVLRVLPSINRIVSNVNALRYGEAAIRSVGDDIRTIDRESLPTQAGTSVMSMQNNLQLQAVSFRYEGANADAVDSVSLTVTKGMVLGVVGPSGGGKTTLIDLILGLIKPTEGSIEVDGIDIHSDLRSWQDRIGVVSQTVFLLDDTVRNNIALGLPPDQVSEDRLTEAIEGAQLSDYIESLPHGLDTFVGERGIRISGGQRQRVAIARALYRDPEVLILDEGTSALDVVTEAQVMTAVEAIRADRTIIIVAHRLSTVRSCSKIAVIKNGRVSDLGTYEELRRNDPEFWLDPG